MLLLKNFLKKIEISPYFYVSLFFVLFFQIQTIFFLTLLFIFLHELSHIVIAKKYNLDFDKIIITPLGMVAIISNIHSLYLRQKLILVSAGVFFNFIMLIFFDLISIFFNLDFAITLKNINLSIILFNLMPIFPLDGSKFLLYSLGNLIGDIKALNFISKLSLFFSYLFLLLGVLQIVLVPYNITILCFSIYFIINNNLNISLLSLEYYKNLYTNNFNNTKNLKIKHLLIHPDLEIKDLYSYLSSDYYFIFYIKNINNNFITISQDELLKYIYNYPINTKISEILIII